MTWQPIETAPKNGDTIEVGWLPNGELEHGPITTRWRDGQWVGGWTPTHWLPITDDEGTK